MRYEVSLSDHSRDHLRSNLLTRHTWGMQGDRLNRNRSRCLLPVSKYCKQITKNARSTINDEDSGISGTTNHAPNFPATTVACVGS